ncbi:MAG: YdcF family protein [Ignavibacteriales bacterium]|nr:YdcF family protein [Ignavibacteriales bacterium]
MKLRFQNTGLFISVLVTVIVNLFILLYLKYHLNGIPLNEFRVDYFGNILNLIFSFLLFVGIIIHYFRKDKLDKKKLVFLIALQFFITLSMGLIYLIASHDLLNQSGYLFNFPVKKVYSGFLFIVGELFELYSLLYVWGLIFGSENLFEIRTFVRMIVVIFILLVISLFYVWNVRTYDEKKIANEVFEYGCIPGAAVWSHGKPSPIFEGRIRKAFDLYKKGIIKQIILTGGNAPGEISESQAAYKFLRNLNVPDKNLKLETESSTTTLQIKYLYKKYFTSQKLKPILIVSDGFHLTRITQIAKYFNVNVVGVASGYTLSFDKTIYYRTRESIALLLFWIFAI